jgi:hypothetical protein
VEKYSTPEFMSSDSGGIVRSTYMFNPRVNNPTNSTGAEDLNRAFQKTSKAGGHRLFAMDYLETTNSAAGILYTANDFAHYPSKGWTILFTDGSAKYVNSAKAFDYATKSLLPMAENVTTYIQYAIIFNFLEADEK